MLAMTGACPAWRRTSLRLRGLCWRRGGVVPKKILNNIRVEIDKKRLAGPEPALKAVQNAA